LWHEEERPHNEKKQEDYNQFFHNHLHFTKNACILR
jgi:hypothetical protein